MIDPQHRKALGLPIAIDPIGCGCTECITGEYVPLDKATERQIDYMIAGAVRDNTEMTELAFDEYLRSRGMI